MSTDLTEQSLEQAMVAIQALMQDKKEKLSVKPTKLFLLNRELLDPKHYKVVRHPTKPYVRNYKRPVKGGLSLLEAVFSCVYAQPECRMSYPSLYRDE